MKKKTAKKKAAPKSKKNATPRRVAPAPKKKALAPKKKKPAATRKTPATKKALPAKKAPAKKSARAKATAGGAKKRAVAKKAPARKKTTLARSPESPLSSRPPASQSALDVSRQLPEERPLNDEEREAMSKVAQTALVAVGATGEPSQIVASIASYVDDIRQGQRQAPSNQDIRLGLGVLWGEQVRAQVGWRWVHLSYPNGFASYALVPDDRAFACFPLNRVSELLTRGADGGTNTSVPLFESIRTSQLPSRRGNAYLVIG